jgi:hypothetical protein
MPYFFRACRASLACLVFSGCGVLLVEGGPGIGHRYYAVYSDDGKAVVVAEESYTWNCSGTMARCRDRESDFHDVLYRIDPEFPARRDTLAVFPGGRGIVGSYYDPVLFLSLSRDRLLYAYSDSSRQYHLEMSSADGHDPFDLETLPKLRDGGCLSFVPSPGFGRAACMRYGEARTLTVYFLDLDTREMADSIRIPMTPDDTASGYGRGLLWESDSSLVVYSRTPFPEHAGNAYRIRGGRLTDSIPELGCLPLRITSSSPFDESGNQIVMADTGLVKFPRDMRRCRP